VERTWTGVEGAGRGSERGMRRGRIQCCEGEGRFRNHKVAGSGGRTGKCGGGRKIDRWVSEIVKTLNVREISFSFNYSTCEGLVQQQN